MLDIFYEDWEQKKFSYFNLYPEVAFALGSQIRLAALALRKEGASERE
jgi:hypothetical protein